MWLLVFVLLTSERLEVDRLGDKVMECVLVKMAVNQSATERQSHVMENFMAGSR